MSSHDEISAEKQRLRRDQRAARAALDPSTYIDAGQQVARHLLRSSLWPTASSSTTIALFASRADELDVRPLERAARGAGAAVAVPRIDGDDLAFHIVDDINTLALDRFGIPTPSASLPSIALSACALVVVPGVLFSADGFRLGYGRGFYDRALQHVDLNRVIGVLADAQWWPQVPHAPHDVRLRWLCSPSTGVFATEH